MTPTQRKLLNNLVKTWGDSYCFRADDGQTVDTAINELAQELIREDTEQSTLDWVLTFVAGFTIGFVAALEYSKLIG